MVVNNLSAAKKNAMKELGGCAAFFLVTVGSREAKRILSMNTSDQAIAILQNLKATHDMILTPTPSAPSGG